MNIFLFLNPFRYFLRHGQQQFFLFLVKHAVKRIKYEKYLRIFCPLDQSCGARGETVKIDTNL